MCLILLAVQKHPKYKLILAANRDEYYERPSEPPHFWKDAPQVLAGRDLVAAGTWLGITKNGRIAAVTNYRDPASVKVNTPSRGKLVSDFLTGDLDPASYLENIRSDRDRYNGFNLILGIRDQVFWYSNRSDEAVRLLPGVYGVSNRLLDTPWPKVVRAKTLFEEALHAGSRISTESLFLLLKDRTVATDDTLPSTGVSIEWERILSPIFITSRTYGTRSSTLIFIENEDHVTFLDRTFDGQSELLSTSEFEFVLDPAD